MTRDRILVVDDEPFVADIISRWLRAEGYECERASNGWEALEALRGGGFALVVTDIMMPGMSGVELLEQVRLSHPGTAVIMLTGVDDRETATRAVELGAYGYVIKPFERNEILIEVAGALKRRHLELLRDRYEKRLEQEVERRTAEARYAQEEITLRLMAASEFRSAETGAHVRRMGLYAEEIGKALGYPQEHTRMLRLAAPMHDVGKIGIPDAILLKPGKLSDEEFQVMKTHTTIGARMLEGSGIGLLDFSSKIARYHHERWDGSGYPTGLAGTDIPESARIVAVIDVYDALVHERIYRPAVPEPKALALIREKRGSHFDPHLVDVFMDVLPQVRRISAEVKDEEQPVRARPAAAEPDVLEEATADG